MEDPKMNWDQIERKWDEMTRRVQSPSSASSTLQARPLMGEAGLSLRIDPSVSPRPVEGVVSGKLYE